MSDRPITVSQSILKQLKRALISRDEEACQKAMDMIDDIIESQEEHLREGIERSIEKTLISISPREGSC